MAILENRLKKNTGSVVEFLRFILIALRGISAVILIMLCLNLLYGSGGKRLNELTFEAIGGLINITAPVYGTVFEGVINLTDKFYYLQNLAVENTELKLEIAGLKGLQEQTKAVQADNASLRELLKVVPAMERGYITARLLSISSTPFSKTAVIAAGKNAGVDIDRIVASGQGLIGRVIEVSNNYSKVMLVNDPNSRIPVISSVTRERGILASDGINTQILYLPNDRNNITEGEIIETSGDGAIYPPGLAIAKVSKITGGNVTVKPLADLSRTNFVVVYTGD